MERISSLAREARAVPDSRRASVAAHLNALMGRLTSEVAPAEGAAFLHRLLGEGRLDGLEDEEGVPSSIVATRIFLELGYPHALEVAPERLEALRKWKQRPPPVPWLAIALMLFVAFIVQLAFATFGHDDHRLFRMSADALAGLEPPPSPSLWESVSRSVYSVRLELFFGQVLAQLGAFLLAVTVGWTSRGHWLTRRVFLGLAVLGLVAGVPLWWESGALAMSIWVGAAASLVSGRVMKER